MLDKVVNVPLLSHPMNWLIVWTVLLFGAVAYHLVMKGIRSQPVSTVVQG